MKFFSRVLSTLVGTILAGIILFVIIFVIIAGIMSSAGKEEVVTLKEHTVLVLELDKKITDMEPEMPFSSLVDAMNFEKTIGLNELLNNISKAKEDKNIDGIFLKLSSINAGISTVEEIREALADFKESGKFLISHANVYSHKSYYLASVSDKVYLTPEGLMEFVGLSAQLMFYKRAFKKFGIEPVILRHGKFKSAVEPFMLEKMSEANREQITTFIGAIWNNMLEKIARARNLDVDELNKMANELSIKNAESCVQLGLVDGLKYYDEVLDILLEKTGAKKLDDLEYTVLSDYSKVPKKRNKDEKGLAKDKIAVIYATGEIVDGEGDKTNIGAASLSRTIRKARNDDKIKAIVLRINSPGGSALASEVIWREVKLAKQAKPFIVSMGDVAASGGYYIACEADTIVANRNTITGSIGVFGVLFNLKKLLNDKIGITTDKVNTNKHSDIGTVTREIAPEEKAYILGLIEDIYSTFTKHVAEGRGMTVEEVDKIGQGRVWSGVNAKEIGLIDVFGGLNKAIEIAAEKAELGRYRIKNFPEKKEPFDAIMEQLGGEAKAHAIENELGDFAPYFQMLKNIAKQKGIQARMPLEININ